MLTLRIACCLALCVWLPAPTVAATISGHVTGPHGEKLTDAVVFVVGPKGGVPPQKHPVLAQQRKSFIPHVMAVLKGTTVEFPNRDVVFHNVFSLRDGKRFDLGLYPVGTSKSVVFDQPGLVRVFCNIHSNMNAFIYVLENPYFAVTDSCGAFTISHVPDGEFEVSAWHEDYSEKSRQIAVHGDRTVVDFPFTR